MKTGTKIGWALVALAIFISVWVLTGGISKANTNVTDVNGNGYEIDDSGMIVGFTFANGQLILPSSANSINDGLFANQSGITDVDASHISNVGTNAFAGCTNLASINLASASNIGGSAFDTCSSLSSVTLSGSLSNIGDNAFKSCVNLVGVTIPANVSYISSSAFSGCSKLASINVDPSNPNYSSDGIALYSVSGTTLVVVPPAAGAGDSKYTVKSGCTNIAAGALTGNTNIKYLHLPSSVTTWGDQGSFEPDYIYLADDYDSGLWDYLQNVYRGEHPHTIITTESSGPTPGPVPPGPTPTYQITSIVENTDGTVTIKFNGPNVDAGSVKGQALQEGINGKKDITSGTTVITLFKDFVDSLRPATGTESVQAILTYGGIDYPGLFNLSAKSTPTPPPTPNYTISPTYYEMYNTDGTYTMTLDAAPSAISSITVQNLGEYDLWTNGYATVAANGAGSRVTVSSNYIRSLTPGSQYVIKVGFNDGASAVASKLYIKTTGGGSSSGGGSSHHSGSSTISGTGSSIVSGSSYTQPASSTLYGNGSVTTTTASSTTGTTHTKDTTPSTADGWDARLAFAIALLLAGVVVLMRSRKNAATLEMIKKDRE